MFRMHLMTNDLGQQMVKCHVPLPLCQMSNPFPNINVICIMQTFKFIDYIG